MIEYGVAAARKVLWCFFRRYCLLSVSKLSVVGCFMFFSCSTHSIYGWIVDLVFLAFIAGLVFPFEFLVDLHHFVVSDKKLFKEVFLVCSRSGVLSFVFLVLFFLSYTKYFLFQSPKVVDDYLIAY